ncbi:MAG TPA: tetratricopeptide repeat protein, partial [Candidatus Methanomethylophilaceae archaeon]|nr:tetratricopeptide repeat protein [Candidatus Methanomethylophilaceae archaeon]
MEDKNVFFEVRKVIAAGQIDVAEMMLKEIALSSKDPFLRIQCASTLLVIGRGVASEEVLYDLYEDLSDYQGDIFPIAQAMRGLGRADLAVDLLADIEKSDVALREYALSLNIIGLFSESIDVINKIKAQNLSDKILAVDSYSSMGRYEEAMKLSDTLYQEAPGNYGVLRSRCATLISSGRDKEAVKFVRSLLKVNKNSANANAITAYVMHVIGNTKPAGAFSSKALRVDPSHVGAMEILALSLMEKGKFGNASIVAGA